MEMVFKFAEGSRLRGNPQAIGEKLHEIRRKRGRLVAGDVVDEAHDKKSPLYGYFEWNDKRAALEYRLVQARHLIRSIVVFEPGGEGDARPVRAFARVTVDDENTYEAIEVVLKDPELRVKVLKEIQVEIARLKQKLAALQGFSDVMSALNQVDVLVDTKLRVHERREMAVPG